MDKRILPCIYHLAELALCIYTGDPHVKTYDDATFDYQGQCYVSLTAVPDDFVGDEFRVTADSEFRQGVYPDVTFPKLVNISFNGDNIEMHRDESTGQLAVKVSGTIATK